MICRRFKEPMGKCIIINKWFFFHHFGFLLYSLQFNVITDLIKMLMPHQSLAHCSTRNWFLALLRIMTQYFFLFCLFVLHTYTCIHFNLTWGWYGRQFISATDSFYELKRAIVNNKMDSKSILITKKKQVDPQSF